VAGITVSTLGHGALGDAVVTLQDRDNASWSDEFRLATVSVTVTVQARGGTGSDSQSVEEDDLHGGAGGCSTTPGASSWVSIALGSLLARRRHAR